MISKTRNLFAVLFLLFLVSSCCSLQTEPSDEGDTNSSMKKKEIDDQNAENFDKLLALLIKEGNYKGPLKKNPFIKDHEFVKGNTRIEISSYNAKFKIVTDENSKPKTGQYDLITNDINAFVELLNTAEIGANEISYKPNFLLLEVGSKRMTNTEIHIDNFPIKGDINHSPKMTKTHAERLKELILNVTEMNDLYILDNSSGTSGLFTPTVAMRFSKGQDVLIALGIPTVIFYENGEAYRGIKMNPSSDEFIELKKIISTYYPTINLKNENP
ncbi:hypothetical protein [Dokdonia sp.]|uniref:hypothetical protein n=1 Tax=Dokdonia sp. TaxID=2024995 RepID=UPI00326443A8